MKLTRFTDQRIVGVLHETSASGNFREVHAKAELEYQVEGRRHEGDAVALCSAVRCFS